MLLSRPRCSTATDTREQQARRTMVPDNTILHPIAFASKTGEEHRYSNIERETLGILHGLKSFTIIVFPGKSMS